MPTYVPYEAIEPDVGGTLEGVLAGYRQYPAKPADALVRAPGDGSRVTVAAAIYAPMVPPLDRNQFLQAVNEMLGVEIRAQFIPGADVQNKQATIIASGDQPDFLQLAAPVPSALGFFEAKCADLTEFLSGPAIKEYPFLADIPTEVWRSVVTDGRIFALPVPRAAVGPLMYRRDDLIAERGLDPDPKSFADFKRLCADLTNAKERRWAMASPSGALIFVQQMLGVPNGWSVEEGEFTSAVELPETKEALNSVRELVRAGVFHPDSFSGTLNTDPLIDGGLITLHYNNYTTWTAYEQRNAANERFELGGMLPPAYDSGSKASLWKGNPNYAPCVVRKGDENRVDQLLKVANAMAAPFGTKEYLLLKYGVAGVHYDLRGTDPVLNPRGKTDVTRSLNYITDTKPVLYEPGNPRLMLKQHAYQRKAVPVAHHSAALGLYSQTGTQKGGRLGQALADTQSEILQGRKPLSAWDDAVAAWRTGGGDEIRHEYEEAYAAAQ